MKTILVRLAALITLVFCNALILAQDDNRIAYGELAEGEITIQQYETQYSFEANAGDIIRAVLAPKQSSFGWSDWHKPELILLDSNLDVIVALHSHDSATVIQELEETGEYHLIATGWGGRTENTGKFSLRLERIPILTDGAVTNCEASSDRGAHYAVRADGDFAIAYQHTQGAFRPEVSVNVIANDPYHCDIDSGPSCQSGSTASNMYDVAALSGSWLESGTIEVKVKSGISRLYIVQVAKPEWSFYENKKTAKFTLELNKSDS